MPRRISRLKQSAAPAPKKLTLSDLINVESKLGRTLFGPIPQGHRREFFQYQKNVWLWHESWHNEKGEPKELTVRYEVRTSGVFKKPLGGKYIQLKGRELENFRKAVHAYGKLVKDRIYK